MQQVGVIQQLARFPVKSMRGEALAAAGITLHGLSGDRRYAFVQAASRSSFPWFTAREMPELLRFQTKIENGIENGNEGEEAAVIVTAPGGRMWRIDSPELRQELEARSGRALFLLHDHRGSFDSAPVSLISSQTVARIAQETGTAEDAWRFRPNLLVDLQGGAPFDELAWVGRILRVGGAARIAVIETDQRCMMISLDSRTTQSNPSVLKRVVQDHAKCAGVYATVLTPGRVQPGDPVLVED